MTENDTAENAEVILHFEDVLPKTGWGVYYKFMLGMAFASYIVNATTLFCIAIAIPLSTCEMETAKNTLSAIFISFSIGRCIGGFVLNCLCDIFGRKRFITHTLVLNFAATFTAAFSFNYYMIMFAVVFLGSSFEHQKHVVKIHLAEILPKNKRGQYLAECDLVWTFGFLVIAVITYFVGAPSYIDHRITYMRLTTWRMLFAVSGGLNLVTACASALLEESPRYFLHMGKEYLALLTLKQFYAINRSSYGNSFDVKENDIAHLILSYDLFYQSRDNDGFIRRTLNIATLILKATKLLFVRPIFKTTIVLSTVQCVLNLLPLVSINILLAKLMTTKIITSGMELVYVSFHRNDTFCPNLTENNVFYNFFIISTNILLGQLVLLLLIDRIQRKLLLFFATSISGLSFAVLYNVKDDMTTMILSSVIMFFVSIATVTVSVIIIESYPTAVRGTAHGVINIMGILLSLLIISFFHMFSNWILIILGIIFMAVSGPTLWLQDYNQKPMSE